MTSADLLQLIAKFVQLIALNLPVVYRYGDCKLVDGVQKFSCLDIYVTIALNWSIILHKKDSQIPRPAYNVNNL